MGFKILNSKNEEVLLNSKEKKLASVHQRYVNDLGYEVDITTLTTILKSITEQKFFEIAPANYIPVVVGEGAWSAEITKYRSFQTGDSFEKGIVNTGSNNTRLASADAAVDSLTKPIKNWANEVSWSLHELNFAQKSMNFDIVEAKERARKRVWDLGAQKAAFIGLDTQSNDVEGLLTMATVAAGANTTRITEPISGMTAAEFKTFCAGVLGDYRTRCNNSAWPTHFVIPESDYLGLAAPTDAGFPLKSSLEVLQDTFRIMTNNPNFQILPCAYGDAANLGLDLQRYALYNSDPDTLSMHIPVDYTNTLANTVNGYQFASAAYGQLTGVQAYRPLEVIYFQYDPTP